MQGILYVSHGSRVMEATAEASAFIQSVKNQVNVAHQEICFLELSEPTVAQGIDLLIEQGASRISIVPVLLLGAGHYFKDIPAEVNKIRRKYPRVQFTYGEPLGIQERITDVLAARINETDVPIEPDAKVLLVGRGSRNPQTKRDIEQVTADLQQKMNIPVDACYLAACEPSFETEFQTSLRESHAQLFIVPYLWFTGVLMQFLETRVAESKKKKTCVIFFYI
ncbi:sirohydrochlorin chelatase [Oceanobacillus massiliensis]|uniref:sirohydrochlorin chelatase n=1 Tax=Oceanobacillus massiliensis TaxID=1465765 RepID=UPI00301B115D